MSTEHMTATDPEIHEPKNITTASNNQVYVADGASSGNWTSRQIVLNTRIDDVSTAASYWVVTPFAGSVSSIYTVIDGAIGTADATITFELSGTAITDGTITIANASSAAGDVDSSSPTANNVVSAGQAIEVITDGASTGTVSAVVTIVIDLS